ncbi:hypothetical protein Leryth_022715, partial [Lithospermum erythrorhizon]
MSSVVVVAFVGDRNNASQQRKRTRRQEFRGGGVSAWSRLDNEGVIVGIIYGQRGGRKAGGDIVPLCKMRVGFSLRRWSPIWSVVAVIVLRELGFARFSGLELDMQGSYVVSLKEWKDGNIWYCVHDFDNGGELLEKLGFGKNGDVGLLEKSNLDNNGGDELLKKFSFYKNRDDGLLKKSIFDDNGSKLLENLIFEKN